MHTGGHGLLLDGWLACWLAGWIMDGWLCLGHLAQCGWGVGMRHGHGTGHLGHGGGDNRAMFETVCPSPARIQISILRCGPPSKDPTACNRGNGAMGHLSLLLSMLVT